MYEEATDTSLQAVWTQVAPPCKTRRKGESATAMRELYKSVLERSAQGEVEEWRDLPGLEGAYIVSSLGRIAKIQGQRMTTGYIATYIPKQHGDAHPLLKGCQQYARHGAKLLNHRAVAYTFVGAPTAERPGVNHKNGNKQDPAAVNLEWTTQLENMRHAHRIRLVVPKLFKYTEEHYRQARLLRVSGCTYKFIAAQLGMTKGAVEYAVKESKRGIK